jgi:hypothetical protein
LSSITVCPLASSVMEPERLFSTTRNVRRREARMTARERRRRAFLNAITADGRTQAAGEVWAAELLHVSPWTVQAWLRPETNKGANELPLWAIELLALKTKRTARR